MSELLSHPHHDESNWRGEPRTDGDSVVFTWLNDLADLEARRRDLGQIDGAWTSEMQAEYERQLRRYHEACTAAGLGKDDLDVLGRYYGIDCDGPEKAVDIARDHGIDDLKVSQFIRNYTARIGETTVFRSEEAEAGEPV